MKYLSKAVKEIKKFKILQIIRKIVVFLINIIYNKKQIELKREIKEEVEQ